MTRVSSLTVLNVVQENRKMVTKVVGYKRLKRVIYMSREEKKEFPTFSGFVKFLATESNVMCDPTNLRSGKFNEEKKRAREPRKDLRLQIYKSVINTDMRNFATKSEEKEQNNGNPPY
jgi:hypothetical protein